MAGKAIFYIHSIQKEERGEPPQNLSTLPQRHSLGTTSSQRIVLADPRPKLARDGKNQPKVFKFNQKTT